MAIVDPIWMRSLLAVHITAGFTSFLLAPVALATAKGGKAHKRWGMVYLWAMGFVAATALPMALYRPVLFLALVAIFSFYCGVLRLSCARAEGPDTGRIREADRLGCRSVHLYDKRLPRCIRSLALGLGAAYGDCGSHLPASSECVWRLARCTVSSASQRKRCSGGTRTLVTSSAAISPPGRPSRL